MFRANAKTLLKLGTLCLAIPTSVYFGLLGLLIAVPDLQTHAFYLHRATLTWFDPNVPEMFGFAPNQVTPFYIRTSDGESLHAWHVLPLGLYERNQEDLLAQPSGPAQDITTRRNFQLLRNDPEARLVIYLHGTSGTIASGWRPDSYRTIYSAAPEKIRVLTVEYRGYGMSSGMPSEEGLLKDAISAVDWAMNEAQIPAERIVLFGQSLGTAVTMSLARHFSLQPDPVSFAGIVLVASFTDVATLTGTYRIGGYIPVLSPLKMVPCVFAWFTGFLHSTWLSKHHIAEIVKRHHDSKGLTPYHITMIQSEDDIDIPFEHTEQLFWHAVNATTVSDMDLDDFEYGRNVNKENHGAGDRVMDWRTDKGLIRKQILRYGTHNKVMSYPVCGLAVLRAFRAADPGFMP